RGARGRRLPAALALPRRADQRRRGGLRHGGLLVGARRRPLSRPHHHPAPGHLRPLPADRGARPRLHPRPPRLRGGLHHALRALAAVALLIKPSGVAALALAALWLLLRRRGEGAGWAAWLRAEATLGLGFAAGLVPALVHGLLTAPGVYLDAVLLYRLRADSLV